MQDSTNIDLEFNQLITSLELIYEFCEVPDNKNDYKIMNEPQQLFQKAFQYLEKRYQKNNEILEQIVNTKETIQKKISDFIVRAKLYLSDTEEQRGVEQLNQLNQMLSYLVQSLENIYSLCFINFEGEINLKQSKSLSFVQKSLRAKTISKVES